MEMEPVPGLQVRQLGARLRRRPHGARPGHAAHRELARQDRVRALRREEREDARLRRGRAALDPAPAGRRGEEARLHRLCRAPSSSTTSSRPATAQAAQQDYRNLEPAGWYLEDYHMLQGTRTEGFHAAARRHLKLSGVPVETSKGEWGQGQHELNVRYAEVLDMADRHVVFKQCLKELAEAHGHERDLHGQVRRRRRRLELPHPLQPLARRQERLRQGPVRRLPLVPRRLDRARARRDGVLRADDQLLQALRRRLLGADAPRLEHTTTARRASASSARARACASSAASRAPTATPTSRSPPRSPRASTASPTRSSRRRSSSATSTRRATCRGCPTRSPKRYATFEKSAFARRRFGEEVVSTTRHFYRTEAAAYDKAVTDWERRRYFERI